MFKAKRRFEVGGEWKEDNSLNEKYDSLPEDCDFYTIRHWFLKCATAPCFEIFFEKEFVKGYLDNNVSAGDALEIWAVDGEKMVYIYAKMPDENGLVPVSGAY